MNKYYKLIVRSCIYISSITIIFFLVVLGVFSFNDIDKTLVETFTLSVSFFSGVGTFAAVLIAIYAFHLAKEKEIKDEIQAINLAQPSFNFLFKCLEHEFTKEDNQLKFHLLLLCHTNKLFNIKTQISVKDNSAIKENLDTLEGFTKSILLVEKPYEIDAEITIGASLFLPDERLSFENNDFEITLTYMDTLRNIHTLKYNLLFIKDAENKINKIKAQFESRRYLGIDGNTYESTEENKAR